MDPKDIKSTSMPPVAIVGMGGFFPRASGLTAYWHLLLHGLDAISEVPLTHWSAQDYYDPDPKRPDHVYCTRGGFISPVPFDPSAFGIPPNSLEATDTSQLLGLLAAQTAIEDAGYGPDRDFQRDRTSVILGVTGTQELVIPLGARLGHPRWRAALDAAGVDPETAREVMDRIAASYVPWKESSFPGLLGNVVAGRISNRLNLGGTNCAVDAACASSMSAIHLALMEMVTGRSEMVITGGVDLLNDIFMYTCFSRTGILSPTGDARPFSASADGTVLGEGVGILVLKPLAAAERDGDRVYAVIRGIGTSSDGRSQSIYAPRADGQAHALRGAYAAASVEPATIGLVEAHGTGTRVGDAVEIAGLKTVFADRPETEPRCAVGSVKSMIGHTKAAAGAAGLMKAALALHHKVLPPTLKTDPPDPKLDLSDSPFYLNTRRRPWLRETDHPRRAGVSAFGFGGSNFHLVLEEHVGGPEAPAWDGSVQIVALSGDSRQDLTDQLTDLSARIPETADADWLAFEAAKTRAGFSADKPRRLLMVLKDPEPPRHGVALKSAVDGAVEALSHGGGETRRLPAGIYYGEGPPAGGLGVLFPGQGSQYVDMGADLVCVFPEARRAIEAASAGLNGLGHRIYPLPAADSDDSAKARQEADLRRTDVAQPAIGAVSLAILAVLERFGIRPDAAAGHSFGELVALRLGGAIDADALMDLAAARGRAMAEADDGSGGMLAVFAPLADIEALAERFGPDLVLANRNSPNQGVLSGPAERIEAAAQACGEAGWRAVRLPVAAAFHTPPFEAATAPFREALGRVSVSPASIPVYANVTAGPYPDSAEAVRRILADQMVRPVRFMDQIRRMVDDGVRTFLEAGPKAVLTGLVRSTVDPDQAAAIAVDASSGRDFGVADLARALCELAARGYPVTLTAWERPAPEPRPMRMRVSLCGANYRLETPSASKDRPTPAASNRPSGTAPLKTTEPKTRNPEPGTQNPEPRTHSMRMNEPRHSETITAPSKGTASSSLQDALRVVQEGFRSMQAIQSQTARTHEKFLESQTAASKTLQEMMAATQRLAESALYPGDPPSRPETRSSAPAAAPVPPQRPPDDVGSSPEPRKAVFADEPGTQNQEPGTQNPEPKTRNPEPKTRNDDGAMEAAILAAVAELTGYPEEALELDMDIEADLGIDSIKRVEILSAVEERLPGLPAVSPEEMGSLRTLRQIIDLMEQSGGSPPSAPGPDSAPQVEIEAPLLAAVAELTGYPVEALELDMDIEADLGIDSIKRVEILSAVEERLPGLPAVSPEEMGELRTLRQIVDLLTGPDAAPTAPAEAPPAQTSAAGIEPALLATVAELTGYPEEALDLDMDIESDLGIDSIKRVEILSAMEERLPNLPAVSPEAMGELRTLRQIVDYLTGPETAPPTPRKASEVLEASEVSNRAPASVPVERRVIQCRPVSLNDGPTVSIPAGRKVLITEDSRGLSGALADALAARGISPSVLSPSEMAGPAALDKIGGLVILADAWSADDVRLLKSAFYLARAAAPALAASGAEGGALFATVTRMDGTFGFGDAEVTAPAQGGLAGLAKTAAIEWPDIRCRAIDLSPDWTDRRQAARSVVEAILKSGPVEIGITPAGMTTPVLVEAPYSDGALRLDPGDLVVVTGGARGVTAMATEALAAQVRLNLVIIGRSPEPTPDPDWIVGLTDETEIRRRIIAHDFDGRTPPPRDLNRAFGRRMANREAGETIARLQAAGATVRYISADVRDEATLRSALDAARREWGPVRAAIHGAGVLEDRRIIDKTDEQLDRVLDTKVDGFRALVSAVGSDPLKYLVLFSSVSARMGNAGQADYAMANEVLNKLAGREQHRRPDCRVVAINWGPWDGGMVTDSLRRAFERQGIALIQKDAGAEAMVREMRGEPGRGAVEVVIGAGLQQAEAEAAPPEGQNDSPSTAIPDLTLTVSREIDRGRYPVLDSHLIDGTPAVPFALMAEWLGHGALHGNPGLFLKGLEEIRLVRDLRLTEASKHIRLMAGKARRTDGVYRVDVEIRDGVREGAEQVHSRARAILADGPESPPPFDLTAYLAGPADGRTAETIYNGILPHGTALRGIEEIRSLTETAVVARLKGAPAPDQWMAEPLRSRWIGDPLVLDSAFQMAALWCHERTRRTCQPRYAEAYQQFRRRFPADGVTAVMAVTETDDRTLRGDFTFLDADQNVVARITGYEAEIQPIDG